MKANEITLLEKLQKIYRIWRIKTNWVNKGGGGMFVLTAHEAIGWKEKIFPFRRVKKNDAGLFWLFLRAGFY